VSYFLVNQKKYLWLKVQWKSLNRASVYRANRLLKQFRLKKSNPISFLL